MSDLDQTSDTHGGEPDTDEPTDTPEPVADTPEGAVDDQDPERWLPAADDVGEEWVEVDAGDDWVTVDEWGRVLDDEADDYVAVPKQGSWIRRLLWVAVVLVLLLVLFAGGIAFWVNSQINPSGAPGDDVAVEVGEGVTLTELAGDLEADGIITNGLVFRFYARQEGFEDVQAGVYEGLTENMAMGDVIDILQGGPAAPPAVADFTLTPGLRLTDARERILTTMTEFDEAELDAALAAARSAYQPPEVTNLEGFLFPDTYRIEQGDEDNEEKLVNQMTARFDEVATAAGYDAIPPELPRTPYELVIIASIIEREAKLPEDQAKVSQVIHNRLALGMPLEVDATLLYELGHKETLTQSDLETPSPYNTRLNLGLTPTPISMPGPGAIEAAINPEPGPWLFYVLADEQGGHFFTDNYDEFLRVAQESRDQGLFE